MNPEFKPSWNRVVPLGSYNASDGEYACEVALDEIIGVGVDECLAIPRQGLNVFLYGASYFEVRIRQTGKHVQALQLQFEDVYTRSTYPKWRYARTCKEYIRVETERHFYRVYIGIGAAKYYGESEEVGIAVRAGKDRVPGCLLHDMLLESGCPLSSRDSHYLTSVDW